MFIGLVGMSIFNLQLTSNPTIMNKIATFIALFCLFAITSIAQHQNTEAYLGVHFNTVSKKKAQKLNFEKPYGAYLTNIVPNTSAEKNDFKPFDYIYQVDDIQFESYHQNFSAAMDNYKVGDQATIYFIRDGKQQSKLVTFGNQADAQPIRRSKAEDPFLGINQVHKKIPANIVGIPVNISQNSTAKKMGLENSDIITHINGYPIYDMHDAGTAIDLLEVGEEITVKYLRDGKSFEASELIQSFADYKNANHQKKNEVKEVEQIEVAIEIKDMPKKEAKAMKKAKGIKMPVVQNLSIEQLKIFPNPNQGIFNLQFTLPNNADTSIRIFSSEGKLIFANDLSDFEGEFSQQIDLSNNPAGVYYVMIKQGKSSISKKVIITRV